MSRYSVCNWRAVLSLVLVCCGLIFLAPAVGAQIHLTDEATGATGQMYGAAICQLPDLNADGLDEFLVGAPGHITGNGAVFLWLSRDGGTAHGMAQVWTGASDENFGWSVAHIGDVNHDGDPDFAVGAPLANAGAAGNGRVCIFYGGTSLSASPDLVISGQTGGDQFGFSVSAAGDFNGDGRDDLIVGAPYRNSPSMAGGAAYVIYGASGGPSADLGDALYLAGEYAGDHFGWSVTDAGVFFGGNEECVAVGAPDNDAYFGDTAGVVYVYEGVRSPVNPDADPDLLAGVGATAKPFSRYGAAVRGMGDFDGDNLPDLAVGAPMCNEAGSEAGRVEIIFGDSNPSTSGDRYVNGETGGDHFGYALARTWDVAGSGSDDLLIGAPHNSAAATDAGRAYLYLGGSGSFNDAASLTVINTTPLLPGNFAANEFGYAVAGAGDFDGDGSLDYAVGAPNGQAASATPSGYVYLAPSSGTAVANFLAGWQATWRSDAVVQLSFNLSVPASRVATVQLTRLGTDPRTLWDGPAVTADLSTAGQLVAVGSAFSFLDIADPRTVPGYALTVTTTDGTEVALADLTGPGEFTGSLPAVALALDPAWPNPFNPTTRIRFRVPADEAATCLITDLRGHRVRTLFSAQGDGQWRTVVWNGVHDDGRTAASGVYLIRLSTDERTVHRRVVLAK